MSHRSPFIPSSLKSFLFFQPPTPLLNQNPRLQKIKCMHTTNETNALTSKLPQNGAIAPPKAVQPNSISSSAITLSLCRRLQSSQHLVRSYAMTEFPFQSSGLRETITPLLNRNQVSNPKQDSSTPSHPISASAAGAFPPASVPSPSSNLIHPKISPVPSSGRTFPLTLQNPQNSCCCC